MGYLCDGGTAYAPVGGLTRLRAMAVLARAAELHNDPEALDAVAPVAAVLVCRRARVRVRVCVC